MYTTWPENRTDVATSGGDPPWPGSAVSQRSHVDPRRMDGRQAMLTHLVPIRARPPAWSSQGTSAQLRRPASPNQDGPASRKKRCGEKARTRLESISRARTGSVYACAPHARAWYRQEVYVVVAFVVVVAGADGIRGRARRASRLLGFVGRGHLDRRCALAGARGCGAACFGDAGSMFVQARDDLVGQVLIRLYARRPPPPPRQPPYGTSVPPSRPRQQHGRPHPTHLYARCLFVTQMRVASL